MDKKELRENTEFSIFSVDREHWKRRAGILHEYVEWEMRTIDDALEFLEWYLDDADTECPFSRETIKKLADDLVDLATRGTDANMDIHRHDYRSIFRYANYSVYGGVMSAELVRLMDYYVETSENSQ